MQLENENSKEFGLILACIENHNSNITKYNISELLKNKLDWDFIYSFVLKNGVVNLFFNTIIEFDIELIPELYLNKLKERVFFEKKRIKLIFEELTKIQNEFNHNDIQMLLMKGPVLSLILYKSSFGRYFNDIDILVKKEKIKEASGILTSMGYVQGHIDFKKNIIIPASFDMIEESEKNRHVIEFIKYLTETKDVFLSIEIHHSIVDKPVEDNKIVRNFFDNPMAINYNENVFFSYDLNYLFMHLCIHLYEHCIDMFFLFINNYVKLKWFVDVYFFIESYYYKINWRDFIILANYQKYSYEIYYALYFTWEIFKSDKIKNILNQFENINNSNLYDLYKDCDSNITVKWDINMQERLIKSIQNNGQGLHIYLKNLLANARLKKKSLKRYYVQRNKNIFNVEKDLNKTEKIILSNKDYECNIQFMHNDLFLFFKIAIVSKINLFFDRNFEDWIRQNSIELVINASEETMSKSVIFLLKNLESSIPTIYSSYYKTVFDFPNEIQAVINIKNNYILQGKIKLKDLNIDFTQTRNIGMDIRFYNWNNNIDFIGWSGKELMSNINAFDLGEMIFEK